ncbi:MAG: hypothetical protein H6625_09135 [Bdellovibrionaceae bacterium]|nr:hypothetical protein [Pseudobdellovibrionaceae bacterium]
MTRDFKAIILIFGLIGIANYSLANSCNQALSTEDLLNSIKANYQPEPTIPIVFKNLNLEIQSIPELETRISFLNQEISNELLAQQLLSRYYPEMIQSVQEMTQGRAIINNSVWNNTVQIAPLSSEFEEYHVSGFATLESESAKKVNQWELKDSKPDEYTNQIPNEKILGGIFYLKPNKYETKQSDRYNYIDVYHWVSWASETAVYYDYADSHLQNQGWAVRLKMWSPKNKAVSAQYLVPQPSDLKNIVRMALTIKKSHGNESGLTSRQEYHVHLPLDFNLEEIPELIAKVIGELSPDLLDKDSFPQPKKRIDTNRIALNLRSPIQQGGELIKVGFITVDRFTRYTLYKGSSIPRFEGSATQLEAEVLPEFHQFLNSNGSVDLSNQIQILLDDIQRNFKGQKDLSPKYITPKIINPMKPND